jgi:hypothetical protein
MYRMTTLLLLPGLLFACGKPSVADPGPDRLRVAMIGSDDLRESGAEDVVSASLAQEIRDGLVDRTQIDRLRAELDLAAFCSPRAVGERLALGRALGADMLVILRTREGVRDDAAFPVRFADPGGDRRLPPRRATGRPVV